VILNFSCFNDTDPDVAIRTGKLVVTYGLGGMLYSTGGCDCYRNGDCVGVGISGCGSKTRQHESCGFEIVQVFITSGNVTIVNQNNGAASITASLYDTVGALMVPSPFVQNVVESMRSAGYVIDSMHTFTDLRGGQEDTGDEQVLVVWTATGKSLEEVASG
jgi:hypothetical protein